MEEEEWGWIEIKMLQRFEIIYKKAFLKSSASSLLSVCICVHLWLTNSFFAEPRKDVRHGDHATRRRVRLE
jgi:hypothetical protein